MRQLVLIGGGHAHVEVIRRFKEKPIENAELCVISPDDLTPYSGMIPGVIAGIYQKNEAYINLPRLCDAPRIRFIKTCVVAIDNENQSVTLNNGEMLHYHVLSINTGVTPDMSLVDDSESVTPVKPIDGFYDAWQHQKKRLSTTTKTLNIYIVGGGAASCEIAAALKWQIDDINPDNLVKWHVIAPKNILPEYHPNVRKKVHHYFQRNDINIIEKYVHQVRNNQIELGANEPINSDWTLWALPGVAGNFLSKSPFELSEKNEMIVDAHLNAIGYPNVFAAGDCIKFTSRPLRKTGVYPVRQAPILDENIRKVFAGNHNLRIFKPRITLLNILLLNPRYAVLSYGPAVFSGHWIQRLKSQIDLSFMRRYQD